MKYVLNKTADQICRTSARIKLYHLWFPVTS